MSEMVVITETSKITSLKLGMWLLYMPLLGGFQYVYVESLSSGYATLSNGLTINADGGRIVGVLPLDASTVSKKLQRLDLRLAAA